MAAPAAARSASDSGSRYRAAEPPIRKVVRGASGNRVRTRSPAAARRIASASGIRSLSPPPSVAIIPLAPDRLEGFVGEHPHVAAAHRHHEVAVADLPFQEGDHVAPVRQVDRAPSGLGELHPVDDKLPRHAGDRGLGGPVHVGHDDHIGAGHAGAELAPQRLHARVPMRLDQRDQAARIAAARGRDRHGHLGRGVPVVVEELAPRRDPAPFEAAMHAGEASQRGRGLSRGPLPACAPPSPRRRRSAGCGGRRRAAAPTPWNRPRAAASPSPPPGRGRPPRRPDRCRRRSRRSWRPRRHVAGRAATRGIVAADDERLAPLRERGERVDDLVQSAGVEVDVVDLDVGDHTAPRADQQEGAVALVRLEDERVARAVTRAVPALVQVAADQVRGIDPGLLEDHREHRRHGGLPVRARDGHRPAPVGERSERLLPPPDRDPSLPRRFELDVRRRGSRSRSRPRPGTRGSPHHDRPGSLRRPSGGRRAQARPSGRTPRPRPRARRGASPGSASPLRRSRSGGRGARRRATAPGAWGSTPAEASTSGGRSSGGTFDDVGRDGERRPASTRCERRRTSPLAGPDRPPAERSARRATRR